MATKKTTPKKSSKKVSKAMPEPANKLVSLRAKHLARRRMFK